MGYKQRQDAFADQLRVSRTTQSNYERGERSPDSDYLLKAAALGVDVLYVVTGKRAPPVTSHMTPLEPGVPMGNALVLTAEEAALLDNYRHSSEHGKRAVEAAAAALAAPPATETGGEKAA